MRTLAAPPRFEAYERLAERRAAGDIDPVLLDDERRRLHVRATLLEDHAHRIRSAPESVRAKFDKLAKSPYRFFRGTALLFYRDLAGYDTHLPAVLTLGDVHPENFGVMPSVDGTPFFGVNDFDEACIAPYTFDLRRGAVGFELGARAAGASKKARRKIVRKFLRGYFTGLADFAQDDREMSHQFRLDNSPKIIRDLIEDAMTSREAFLADLCDPETGGFAPSKKIVPKSSEIELLSDAIARYAASNEKLADDGLEVIDVARRRGSGTASLGLPRWWVLVRVASEPDDRPRVLELKRSRVSALNGLTGRERDDREAARIVQSQRVHLVGGDRYFGHVEIGGESFMVRERSPFKDAYDVDDLSPKQLKRYAAVCGWALAQAHARSDEDFEEIEDDVERRILESCDVAVTIEDLLRDGLARADRVVRDWKRFKSDLALGAFDVPTSHLGD